MPRIRSVIKLIRGMEVTINTRKIANSIRVACKYVPKVREIMVNYFAFKGKYLEIKSKTFKVSEEEEAKKFALKSLQESIDILNQCKEDDLKLYLYTHKENVSICAVYYPEGPGLDSPIGRIPCMGCTSAFKLNIKTGAMEFFQDTKEYKSLPKK